MKEKLFTRNFTLLILGQVSSLIGNYSLKFALSMYILEQTGSASVFAGITAVSMLPMILFSPFGGTQPPVFQGPGPARPYPIRIASSLPSGFSVSDFPSFVQ